MPRFRAGADHAVRRCAEVINAADGDRAALRDALRASGETDAELTDSQARRLREAARTMRAIALTDSMAQTCEQLNAVLAGCRPPRLTAHGATPWHLHIDGDDDADWAEWFLASSAMALAISIAETQQPPLGVCQSPSCGNVFAARGPGRPRRYCSDTCSTRARVAAHRSRA